MSRSGWCAPACSTCACTLANKGLYLAVAVAQTELLNCGINFVRVNMSHANQEWGHRITDHLRYFLHANPGKVCMPVLMPP